ncbi:SDR family oxidoreductase [Virgibacillus sediminis]|uniref:SDR family oxidoreductase n=1 Tax=Virgibacillus sediminis TaxID=202260 RepID=A0ABV7A2N3_9BACI
MDMKLEGKSVLVTASSKGLGKAIATEFAREGAYVLISSRDEDALKEAAEAIKRETENSHVDYQVCDMKDGKQITELVEKAAGSTGGIDVLINNAGGPPAGRFMDMEDNDWYHAFELNLLSFVRTIRATVPYMQKEGEGRIVNVASSSIKQSLDNLVLSNTLRPGIPGLSKTLAQELSEDQILINTVGPGTIETDRMIELNRFTADQQGIPLDELKTEAEEGIPMKRYGRPEEFAKAVVFLASGANTYITGQSLIVDGGLVKAL